MNMKTVHRAVLILFDLVMLVWSFICVVARKMAIPIIRYVPGIIPIGPIRCGAYDIVAAHACDGRTVRNVLPAIHFIRDDYIIDLELLRGIIAYYGIFSIVIICQTDGLAKPVVITYRDDAFYIDEEQIAFGLLDMSELSEKY